MDRLQIAIEKARAQRAEALESRPEPVIGQPPPPEAAPEPGPAAAEAPQPAGDAAAPVAAAAPRTGVWEALPPIDLSVRELRNDRLLTVRGGAPSVPYDLLRTRVLHQARQNGWRRIGLISPTAGSGKTTAAANLAFAFSRIADQRIVVLDLDLRRPNLARMLGQTIGTSMEDVLLGRVDFADHARILGHNVALGFTPRPAAAPSELLQSKTTGQALKRIETDFALDLMIIDLPPMMATDDGFAFLDKVDCVLVLAAAEQTNMDQIEVTLRQLGDLTSVMGIVLNKCHHVRGAYGYDARYYGA